MEKNDIEIQGFYLLPKFIKDLPDAYDIELPLDLIKKEISAVVVQESTFTNDEDDSSEMLFEVETPIPTSKLKKFSEFEKQIKPLISKFKFCSFLPVDYNRGTDDIVLAFFNDKNIAKFLVGSY